MDKNIIIRSAKREDVGAILNIYIPFIKDSAVSFETEIPTEEGFWKRIEKYQEKAPWLVCEIKNEIAGYAYSNDHRSRSAYQWSKELSVYVDEKFRKRGIATGLYTALIELLKIQGVLNTFIGITLPNPASVAFHESMGYRPVGVYHNAGFKFGKWRDVGWWEMPIGNLDATPSEIISPENITTKDWEKAIKQGVLKIL